MIRRFPNGGTPHAHSVRSGPESIGVRKPTRRSEPSQYPEEKKAISDSLSSGERSGKSLNSRSAKPVGVASRGSWDPTWVATDTRRRGENEGIAERPCERAARERDSRVREIPDTCRIGTRVTRGTRSLA